MAYFFHKSLTDPFYAALRIPNALRQLLAEGALSAAFIPTFTQTLEKEGNEEADQLARSLLVLLTVVVSVIVGLGILFAPQLVRLITPGFSQAGAEKTQLTIHLTRIMFPYLLFVSLAALLMGSLHSLGHFTMPALSPVALNLCIIVCVVGGALFLPREKLIYLAAVGFMLGGLAQLLIQYPPLLKMGFYRHLPRVLLHPKIGLIGRLLLPATFGQAVTEINVFVNLYFASKLIEGSVTYLYFAMRLIQFPLGMFGIALATASFPTFSRLALLEDRTPLIDAVRKSLKSNLFLMIPSALGLVVVGPQIIGLLFDRGQFHRDASLMPTYYAMCCYLVGILAYASLKLVVSIYYSFQNMVTPIIVGAVAIICNIILNFYLSRWFSYKGLALGSALASIINVGLLTCLATRYLGSGWWRGLPWFALKSLLASGLMAVAVWFSVSAVPVFGNRHLYNGLSVVISLAIGVAVYLGLSWFLMREDLEMISQRLRRKFAPSAKSD